MAVLPRFPERQSLAGLPDVFFRPALIALQFLTCFPVRLQQPPAPRELGLSLLWYPAVGLLVGIVVWGTVILVMSLATPLTAAVVLTVWVLATGALHLDGLADTADAWVGGRADRERTLAIMKDPRSGPIAVATVVCVLLLKFGGLSALRGVSGHVYWSDPRFACGSVLPPLLGRTAAVLLLVYTPYVRTKGIATELVRFQSRTTGRLVIAVTAITVSVVCGRYGLLAAAIVGVVCFAMRRAFLRRLGGVTGDCVGATIEVTEAASLIAIAST